MATNRLEDLFNDLGIDFIKEKGLMPTYVVKIGKNMAIITQITNSYIVKFMFSKQIDLNFDSFEEFRRWVRVENGTL